MKMVGSNPQAVVAGVDKLPGRINYLIGDDRKKWRANIPTYAQVKYEEVHPGVDVVYYGKGQQLEYDFGVAAGADPDQIRLTFTGADQLEVNAAGDLVLHTDAGELRQQKPFIYQEVAGVRQAVSGSYVVKD